MTNYTGHNLIFVVGCPRSGTTWLQRLLASHSQIRSGEESHFFDMYIGPQLRNWEFQFKNLSSVEGGHLVGPPAYFGEEEFVRIVKNCLLQLLDPLVKQLQPGELFVEKTPSHALFIPEIKQMLPASRIIHIIRDPRDVVASLLAAAQTWGSNWAPERARVAAHIWREHVRTAREAAKKLSTDEFYEIKYEKLWDSTEETLIELFQFLNLRWSPDSIRKSIEANRPEAMRLGGTPIPVYGEVARRVGPVSKLPHGFIRTARPHGWKRELSLPQKLRVWRVVYKTMRDFGYEWPIRDWL
jgi:hypothetical protein